MNVSQSVLSAPEAERLATDLLSRLHAKEAIIFLGNGFSGKADFANNEVRNVRGRADTGVSLSVSLDGHEAAGSTNDVSTEGLDKLVDEVESLAKHHRETGSVGLLLGPAQSFKDPPIYFESTLAAMLPQAQGDLIRSAADLADTAGQIAAGGVHSTAACMFILSTAGLKGYTRSTFGEFSMTARTPSGTGSGWAWGGSEDFSNVRVNEIARRAIEVAKRSENPVAIEPGRYTVIIEPEAVDELVGQIIITGLRLQDADSGYSVFSNKGGGNKLGVKMTDERVQLLYDPMDPLLPFSPLSMSGRILQRTHWIERGILTNLACSPAYARILKREPLINPYFARLEVTTPPQSLDEMVASTKRGVWVHRFGGVTTMDPYTLLLSGITRDGTFLIENGKVTKPIKNMRFSESPFFILNKLEAAGSPVRSSLDMVCPRLKVSDFEFTGLSDAI